MGGIDILCQFEGCLRKMEMQDHNHFQVCSTNSQWLPGEESHQWQTLSTEPCAVAGSGRHQRSQWRFHQRQTGWRRARHLSWRRGRGAGRVIFSVTHLTSSPHFATLLCVLFVVLYSVCVACLQFLIVPQYVFKAVCLPPPLQWCISPFHHYSHQAATWSKNANITDWRLGSAELLNLLNLLWMKGMC